MPPALTPLLSFLQLSFILTSSLPVRPSSDALEHYTLFLPEGFALAVLFPATPFLYSGMHFFSLFQSHLQRYLLRKAPHHKRRWLSHYSTWYLRFSWNCFTY
jgi:hypothetical protein